MNDNAPAAARASTAETVTPTLYYDGQCPLCAGEIESLRRRRSEHIDLVDVHTLPETGIEDERGRFDKTELLQTLHLKNADGSWFKGADANVLMWQGTRRGRALQALRWPVVSALVDLAYAVWARLRYRWLYGAGGHTNAFDVSGARQPVEHAGGITQERAVDAGSHENSEIRSSHEKDAQASVLAPNQGAAVGRQESQGL